MGLNFAEKIKNFFAGSQQVSEDFFDDLVDLLVEGDFGASGAVKLVDELKLLSKKEKINDPSALRTQFAALLEKIALPPGGAAAGVFSGIELPPSFAVIMLLGVNGVGKTTTAAKLAALYRARGRRPILAAADTFRAAAIDQLKIHGERLNIRVVAHRHGGDPAAVVYDAAEAALSGGGDLVITDTAGRMHTKAALVEELKKISRVLETKTGGGQAAYCRKWLVLDATTGRNALAQAEIFHDAVDLDGVILTKYDSSAKGGAVFSLARELSLQTLFICSGEGYDDIKPFDARQFAYEFAGLV